MTMRPHIQPYHSALTPFQIFHRLYACKETAFFLDSPQYRKPDQQYSFVGADPFLEVIWHRGRVRVRGEETGNYAPAQLTAVLRRLMKKYRAFPPSPAHFFTGGMVGYWGYEAASLFDCVRFRKVPEDAPLVYLGWYRDLIVYDHRKKHYWLAVNADRKTSAAQRQKRFQILRDYFQLQPKEDSEEFRLEGFRPEVSQKTFLRMVRRTRQYIAAGDIYQANISQRFSFRYKGSPAILYSKLREINPSPFSSMLKIRDLVVVSSSPERLIRKQGRFCETRPIAGTRPRKAGKNLAQIEKDLLSNEKERAEHIMLVDLERNDLGRVCDYRSVRVKEMMVTEKYSHVVHIVSLITGQLRRGKDGLDLLRAMFPGGTITGCPKIRCMQIIDELEPSPRGLYTGSIGYFDFYGNLDFNIVIRTLVLKNGKGHLQVGAGIVHDSDPQKEYEETLHKGEALAQALASANRCRMAAV